MMPMLNDLSNRKAREESVQERWGIGDRMRCGDSDSWMWESMGYSENQEMVVGIELGDSLSPARPFQIVAYN